MLKREEYTHRTMTYETGRKARSALSASIEKLNYHIPNLTPDDGLSEPDQMALHAIALQAEGIYEALNAMCERLKKDREPKGIISNDEWPRKRVRLGR